MPRLPTAETRTLSCTSFAGIPHKGYRVHVPAGRPLFVVPQYSQYHQCVVLAFHRTLQECLKMCNVEYLHVTHLQNVEDDAVPSLAATVANRVSEWGNSVTTHKHIPLKSLPGYSTFSEEDNLKTYMRIVEKTGRFPKDIRPEYINYFREQGTPQDNFKIATFNMLMHNAWYAESREDCLKVLMAAPLKNLRSLLAMLMSDDWFVPTLKVKMALKKGDKIVVAKSLVHVFHDLMQ